MPSKLYRLNRKKYPNYVRSGRKSYGFALRKFHIVPTLPGPFSATKNATNGNTESTNYAMKIKHDDGALGDVEADSIQGDREYCCEVPIGTPGQVMYLDFDTGSSDLWMWSTELKPAIQAIPGHTIFDPKKSTTYKSMGNDYHFNISFGDRSHAEGIVGTDKIDLGGLIIQNQAVELASFVSKQFQQGIGDGLLGLAWDQINSVYQDNSDPPPSRTPRPQKGPVTNMIDEHLSGQPLFTAHLSTYRDKADPTVHGDSFYTFGYIDQAALEENGINTHSQIHYAPVNPSRGFWEFSSASFSVNGHVIARPNNTAMADTGTSLALVGDDVCEALYAKIPGAKYDAHVGGYVFPTSVTVDQLPDVQFAVGDKLFSVIKIDLEYVDIGNGYYYGGIQSRGSNPFDILGDTFLKSVYAIFDVGNKQFGAVQRV